MTYVNAGANVGYHTILGGMMVGSFGKVFSFEANPHVFSLLKRGVYFNGFFERTSMFNAAVYDSEGETSFRYVREQAGGGGINTSGPVSQPVIRDKMHPLRERFLYGPKDFELVTVRTVTLDAAVGAEVSKIDFLHMDIEGAEGPALLGAKELISQSDDLQMILEWSYHSLAVDEQRQRRKFIDAVEMLSKQRFKFYRINVPTGNVYINPPVLKRVEHGDLFGLGHCDLFLTR